MNINFNVTGPARKELAKAVEELSGQKAKYMGMPTQAYSIGPYTISRTGELFWEEGTDAEMLVEALLERGFEAVTLEEADADESEAHLDVSIPEALLSDEALQNLQAIVDSKAGLLKMALDADELPVLKLNGEIHFPWFKLDASGEETQAYAKLIEKLVEMAKNAKRVTAKEKEAVNPKYEFRCFLLRLGFIGDEYKADRKVLLKNLTGSSAFKSGHKKEYAPGMAPVPTPENTVEINVEEAMSRLQDPQVQEEIRSILNGEGGDEQ